MELLSPAGNVEKLKYAYFYGADASYIGLKNFSLRVKADNFYQDEYKKVIELKEKFPGKKLHCALNISFHNHEIDRLIENIPYFKQYPIDAFIIQDLGIVPIIQKNFPDAQLHLSTQASCMNREAVKMYKSLGFSRVVMGREASLKEIAEIKDAVPDMEIECFIHGAMCIAYAGRCLMSSYLTGRSAQEGFCSHTCRWDYDVLTAKKIAESGELVLREHKRPDEYFPIYEGNDFTAVLSSKDLCMIDHLKELKEAGVDSLKIEGRMKSVYYVALITRAYRKALDALEGKITQDEASPFVDELYKASHRPFTTAFYFNKSDADVTVSGASDSPYELAAEIGQMLSESEENEILKKAADYKKLQDDEYAALCDQAKAAYDKRVKDQPDKHLPLATKIEGYRMYTLEALNMLNESTQMQLVSPNIVGKDIKFKKDFVLINPENGELYNWVCNGHPCVIYTNMEVSEGSLIRTKDENYVEGKFRDSGR
ncbi:MAG: peptidase U32 family protein [Treponema sp.]|nr:U32 family peptidase [Spirochaetia bacterium]MDY3759310.1 peptidase U32 family protein [Treponema sp.]MEE0893655.1 peptidase U32 family protein [Treponema sp.]